MGLIDVLRSLTHHSRPRPDEEIVHASTPIYIRDGTGRVIPLEVAPRTTASWATARALIAFDDPRDAAQCALAFRGSPLPPRRSLAASGVRRGDTLDLI